MATTPITLSNLLPRQIDVYLGRGGIKKNELYRKLIRKHCKEYSEIRNGEKRDFIITNIVEPILRTGRLFYNHSPTDASNVWRIASDDEIVKKIRAVMMVEKEKMMLAVDGAKEEDDDDDEKKVEIIGAFSPNAGRKRKAIESEHNRHTNAKPQQIFHLKEKTGHLLNRTPGINSIYHLLLTKHEPSFRKIPRGMQANNNKIRFVWDNIISKLKKTNCSIVLCPESQKPIDVNPHDLDLFDPDSKHKVITRRTIKCIISVLSDTKYITIERSLMQSNNSGQESANFKQQQQQHQHHVSPMQPMQPSNNNFALARVSMESIAAFDEMSRWIAPHHQQSTQSKALLRQNPTLVSLDSTSSQINQRTCVTNVSNVPKALSNPMLPSQQGAFLRMMQLQNFKIQKSIYETSKRQEAIQASKMQKEAENAQMQQVRMVLDQKLSETYKMQKEAENAQMQQVRMVVEQRLRETNKIQKAIENVKLQKEAENAQMQQIRMVLEQRSRETNKIQKAIENVKLQNASLMMERKKQLELVQQYVKNSAAKSPNPEVRPKVALPKPPVTCSKGPDEPEVRPVQKVVAYSNDRDWEEELYGTETNVDNDDIVI